MMIAPPGFEPGSTAPKAIILDHYTTGLYIKNREGCFKGYVFIVERTRYFMIEKFGIFNDPVLYDSDKREFTEAGLAYLRGHLEAASVEVDASLEAIERSRYVSHRCLEFEFIV